MENALRNNRISVTEFDTGVQSWKALFRAYLPPHVQTIVERISDPAVEEIRLRAGQPLQVCFSYGERLIYAAGGKAAVTAEDCAETLRRICENSFYAWAEELRHGFLTLPGGCRVGVTGRAVLEDQKIARITDVTGLCIRIGRSCPGAAAGVIPLLRDAGGKLRSTLIVSAPNAGKTTMLRELIRCASGGEEGLVPSRVCVVDSRYEIAGSVRGVPQFDLGPRTDVLSGSGKAEGMRILLAAMSPEILAADELSAQEDLAAVTEAAGCGVRVLASVHSGSAGMLRRRASLDLLLRSQLFERFVVLSRRRGPGTVEGVYDMNLQPVKGGDTAC